MISKEYIDLIHKDIDKIISIDEKEKLDKYLKINQEANSFYKELLKTEEFLNEIPDEDPSANLKKRILNSIDYNRYKIKPKINFITKFTSTLFETKKIKYALIFSCGLLIGMILFAAFFNGIPFKNNFQSRNIFGTMGLTETEIVKAIDVNVSDIKGKIKIGKGLSVLFFDIDLQSFEKFKLQIEFDPQKVSLEDFTFMNVNTLNLEKKPGLIKIDSSNNHTYKLIFPYKDSTQSEFTVIIFRNESKIFEHKFF